jgi:hypothetical protein
MGFKDVDIGDDTSFVAAFRKNSGLKDGKTLRTTGSQNDDNGIAMTSYSISDILQGSHARKPAALSANAFNQYLTSQLRHTAKMTEDGGSDGDVAARLQSRKRFLPDDFLNGSFFTPTGAGTSYGDTATEPGEPGEVQSDGGTADTAKYTDTAGVSDQKTAAMANGKSILVGTYKGTTVNMVIIAAWKALVDAAEAAGIQISGGGYRTGDAQIGLRKAHCGTSNFAIYEMSPSACSPPTARPGTSRHEKGLAVDIVEPGTATTIKSHSSSTFQWLAANAATYGFFNLPSEPWHWSVDGG